MGKQEFKALALTHLRLLASEYCKAYDDAETLNVLIDLNNNRVVMYNAYWGRDKAFSLNVNEEIVPENEDTP